MRRHRRLFSALLLLFCLAALIAPLTGCVPSNAYLQSEEQGYFPKKYDYPFAKWVCREKNLYFCMWPSQYSMTGEYVSEEETQGIRVSGFLNELAFTFYTPEEKKESEHKDANGVPFYRYSEAYKEKQTEVTCRYAYHDGIMTCTVFYSEHEDFVQGEVFTFVNVGTVNQSPKERWRCLELDLYLDSYDDVDFFYAGEWVKEGTAYAIWAIQRDVNGKFDILTNGKVSETVSCYLECAYIDVKDDQMIWQITDAAQQIPEHFSFWDYPYATLTFVREPLPQS